LPQHDPGPAHPAWLGELPQQDVSPGPGTCVEAVPETAACADNNLCRLALPHAEHAARSVVAVIKISLVSPQSMQMYSKIGIGFAPFPKMK